MRGCGNGEVGRGDERREEMGRAEGGRRCVCENVWVRKTSETTAEADRNWNQTRRDGWRGSVTKVTGSEHKIRDEHKHLAAMSGKHVHRGKLQDCRILFTIPSFV